MDEEERVESCCKKCGKMTTESSDVSISSNGISISTSSIEKCQGWLEKCTFSDCTSEVSCPSEYSESKDDTQSDTSSALEIFRYQNPDIAENGQRIDSSLIEHDGININKMDMQHCRNVHVGNVTYITGPVHITQNTSSFQQQNIVNKIFLEDTVVTRKSPTLNIIQRRIWLAQPPLSKNPLKKIPKFVVIGHTATEEGFTQADNTLMVRLVQTFHIESKKWDDIAYNFLVGSDGNVYEGRGWSNQGAHTLGYNAKAIGISFVGTYIDHLPPDCALVACQKLIEQGVALGHLAEDYSLVGHCQCVATESPGRHLYELIKTWPRWRELTPQDSAE